jgi:hypothetical protein
VARIPGARRARVEVARVVRSFRFHGSDEYWNERDKAGGTSGPGSYGRDALYKAGVINAFVEEHEIRTVVEFGCGDGHQLSLAHYPEYLGLDVAAEAVTRCQSTFADDRSKQFVLYRPGPDTPLGHTAELALSLDVIFHLTEDDVFDTYMRDLFGSSTRFVLVYSTDHDEVTPWPFVLHRHFTPWVSDHAPGWTLRQRVPAPDAELLDFFVYERTTA